MKQRILGLALSLALMATFGLSLTANADTADSLTVTGNVQPILSLTVDQTSIVFGDMDMMGGTNHDGGLATICTDSAVLGFTGARYVSKPVTVTVNSSTNYSISRGVTNANIGSADQADLLGRTWLVPNAGNACVDGDAISASTITSNPAPFQAGTPGIGNTHAEHFMFDVRVNSASGSYSLTLTYTATVV